MAAVAELLSGISSMATQRALVDLCRATEAAIGIDARFESVGGIDALQRVGRGETFDLVVLAADGIDELARTSHVLPERFPLMESVVAVAVPLGAPLPDVGSEEALRRAVTGAKRIGFSTGPSGVAVMKLFERWGLLDSLRGRLVQAPPGTPVAALLTKGDADFGFQQLSELKHEPGIAVLGPMPPGLEIVTTFVGAIGARCTRLETARDALRFMGSPAHAALKRQHGMADPRTSRVTDSPVVRSLA